jgi:putative transposase
MDVSFCLEALDEALAMYGKPEIFNTDQGSQFTSVTFTDRLKQEGINISMDGRGCWADNAFVGCFWRSLKYEHVCLHAYESVSAARSGIGNYIEFFNRQRPHSSLNRQTPDQVYFNRQPVTLAAWKDQKQAVEMMEIKKRSPHYLRLGDYELCSTYR